VSRRSPDRPPAEGADPRDDRALLAAHVAGDAQAFGELFRRHRDRLWAVALRTTGDPEEAADALQDALVAAFRRAGSYRGDAAVTTWLHRLVVNAALDRLRRRQVRLAAPLPEDPDETEHRRDPGSRPPPADDPADAVEAGDRRRQVLAALGRLPPEQRAALVLVDMEGFSVEEAARVLDVAPGTVKSRCSRGRARLAPLLAGLRSGNPEATPYVPSGSGPDPRATRPPPPRPAGPARSGGPDQTTEPAEPGGEHR
jgi:RNA polymerase sigma-70 factor (ECF subfamily)